jgi:hypothetical protein
MGNSPALGRSAVSTCAESVGKAIWVWLVWFVRFDVVWFGFRFGFGFGFGFGLGLSEVISSTWPLWPAQANENESIELSGTK